MPATDFDLESAYDRYGDGLYRFCLRLIGSSQDAEDLTQETFLAARTAWKSFDQQSSEATWLYAIARRKAAKLARRRKIESVFQWTKPSQADLSRQLAVEASLARLPLHWKEALLLVKLEGFTSKEAAWVLGAPEGTVRFWVHKAIQRLQSDLNGLDESPVEGATYGV